MKDFIKERLLGLSVCIGITTFYLFVGPSNDNFYTVLFLYLFTAMLSEKHHYTQSKFDVKLMQMRETVVGWVCYYSQCLDYKPQSQIYDRCRTCNRRKFPYKQI